jgi:hypothetical protein
MNVLCCVVFVSLSPALLFDRNELGFSRHRLLTPIHSLLFEAYVNVNVKKIEQRPYDDHGVHVLAPTVASATTNCSQ